MVNVYAFRVLTESLGSNRERENEAQISIHILLAYLNINTSSQQSPELGPYNA